MPDAPPAGIPRTDAERADLLEGLEALDSRRAGPRPALADRKLSAAEKRRLALQLRLRNFPYRDIAEIVGWRSISSVHDAIIRELQAIPRLDAEQLQLAELEKLERLEAAFMQKALNGDDKALDKVLAVMKQRARYVAGLEVPVKADVNMSGGPFVVELAVPEPEEIEPVPEDELAKGER